MARTRKSGGEPGHSCARASPCRGSRAMRVRWRHEDTTMTTRMPAALEVSALTRQVSAAGGFAMVLAKGEPDSGSILVVIMENGANSRVYERMPQADGSRGWHLAKREDRLKPREFSDYLARRHEQDGDLWLIELDIPQGERFIGLTPPVN